MSSRFDRRSSSSSGSSNSRFSRSRPDSGRTSKGGGSSGRPQARDSQSRKAQDRAGQYREGQYRGGQSRGSQARDSQYSNGRSRGSQSRDGQSRSRQFKGGQEARYQEGPGSSARELSSGGRPESSRFSHDRASEDRYRRSSGRTSSGDRFDRSDQSRFGRRGPASVSGGKEKAPFRSAARSSSKGEDWRAPKPRWGSRPRLPERPAIEGGGQGTKPETTKPEAMPEAEALGAAAADDLLWGRHATQAALEARRPIHRIWCTAELRSASRFLQLLRDAKASGVLVEEVSWARLGQLTGGAVHQGIALQVASAETLDLSSLIEGCADLGESPLLLALDGLTDPHNLGAIVRSAEALGAHGVVLPQRRSAGLTGSVAKVAAGALEHLPVARVVNMNRSLETLKDKGYRVLGLAEEGDLTLAEADLEGPLVLVTGSEDQGLSLLTRRHCDQLIRIPLRGMTPNLNASVATALCLFEVARRGWMKGLRGQAPSPRIIRPKCSPSMPEVHSEPEPVEVEDDDAAGKVDADSAAIKAKAQIERIDLDASALQEHFDGHIQL